MRNFFAGVLLMLLSLSLFNTAMANARPTSIPSTTSVAAPASVNLNTADVKALMTVHGIGKTKAQNIIQYRQQHGSFKTVDELTKVKGFSQNALAKLEKNNPGVLTIK